MLRFCRVGRTSDLEGDVGTTVGGPEQKAVGGVGVVFNLESVCLSCERVETSQESRIIRLNGASLYLAMYQILITCFGDQPS